MSPRPAVAAIAGAVVIAKEDFDENARCNRPVALSGRAVSAQGIRQTPKEQRLCRCWKYPGRRARPEKYAQGVVLGISGSVWSFAARPQHRHDSALIARDQRVRTAYYLDFALQNGVKPAEVAETITHLAFYTGWPTPWAPSPSPGT
jgi:hypothetical protein